MGMAFVGVSCPTSIASRCWAAISPARFSGQLGQVAGGVLGDLFGWRGVFFVLAGFPPSPASVLSRELDSSIRMTRTSATHRGPRRVFRRQRGRCRHSRWARTASSWCSWNVASLLRRVLPSSAPICGISVWAGLLDYRNGDRHICGWRSYLRRSGDSFRGSLVGQIGLAASVACCLGRLSDAGVPARVPWMHPSGDGADRARLLHGAQYASRPTRPRCHRRHGQIRGRACFRRCFIRRYDRVASLGLRSNLCRPFWRRDRDSSIVAGVFALGLARKRCSGGASDCEGRRVRSNPLNKPFGWFSGCVLQRPRETRSIPARTSRSTRLADCRRARHSAWAGQHFPRRGRRGCVNSAPADCASDPKALSTAALAVLAESGRSIICSAILTRPFEVIGQRLSPDHRSWRRRRTVGRSLGDVGMGS